MFGRMLNFIKYNNAVPLTVAVVMLGAGSAFAASPDLRDAVSQGVISSQEKVVSIDNSYIVNADLNSYLPSIQITGVTEDSDNFYVAYTFTTINLQDYRWQNVTESRMLTVSKKLLNGKDLGLYATGQLAQVSLQDLDRLRRTQDIEKKSGVTPAVVATTYGGLIGKFLDTKEETLPGYVPVIPEPPKPVYDPSAETASVAAATPPAQTTSPSGSSSANTSADTTPPTINILGSNPANVALNSTYSDLGAVIIDNVNLNLGYTVSVDGGKASAPSGVSIDTSHAGTHTIMYIAIDAAGNKAMSTRTVIVGTPPADTTPPVVTLIGAAAMQITAGDTFTDPGATAIDDTDGNITSKISVNGAVDSSTPGSYTLTYQVADAVGNMSSVSRIVTVVAPPAPATDSATTTADSSTATDSTAPTTTTTDSTSTASSTAP